MGLRWINNDNINDNFIFEWTIFNCSKRSCGPFELWPQTMELTRLPVCLRRLDMGDALWLRLRRYSGL